MGDWLLLHFNEKHASQVATLFAFGEKTWMFVSESLSNGLNLTLFELKGNFFFLGSSFFFFFFFFKLSDFLVILNGRIDYSTSRKIIANSLLVGV